MRKIALIAAVTAAWLLANPAVQLSQPGWLEVGVTPALAAQAKQVKKGPHGPARRPVMRRRVRGSSTPVPSNAPGLYPMQTYAPPAQPNSAPMAVQAPPVPGYPQAPSIAILPRGYVGGGGAETYSDKVVRCTHQAGLGGLPSDQQPAYVTTCAGQ
jgi:hypothetical protein